MITLPEFASPDPTHSRLSQPPVVFANYHSIHRNESSLSSVALQYARHQTRNVYTPYAILTLLKSIFGSLQDLLRIINHVWHHLSMGFGDGRHAVDLRSDGRTG